MFGLGNLCIERGFFFFSILKRIWRTLNFPSNNLLFSFYFPNQKVFPHKFVVLVGVVVCYFFLLLPYPFAIWIFIEKLILIPFYRSAKALESLIAIPNFSWFCIRFFLLLLLLLLPPTSYPIQVIECHR